SVFASIAVLASLCSEGRQIPGVDFCSLTRTGTVLIKVFHDQVWPKSGAFAERPRLLPKLRKL
ncbi:MAG: hypothetical protein E6447_24325, partial [Bradyrhizobium sp.]|nr:hypothetical protein [Bradyrhizobium sp.]